MPFIKNGKNARHLIQTLLRAKRISSSVHDTAGISGYCWVLPLALNKLRGPSLACGGLSVARTSSNHTCKMSRPLQASVPCLTHHSSQSKAVPPLFYSEACSSSTTGWRRVGEILPQRGGGLSFTAQPRQSAKCPKVHFPKSRLFSSKVWTGNWA